MVYEVGNNVMIVLFAFYAAGLFELTKQISKNRKKTSQFSNFISSGHSDIDAIRMCRKFIFLKTFNFVAGLGLPTTSIYTCSVRLPPPYILHFVRVHTLYKY